MISQSLITHLRISSPNARHLNDPDHLKQLGDILADSRQYQETLVQYFRDRIKDATKELEELQRNADKIDAFCTGVTHTARDKLILYGIRAVLPRRHHRESEDSQSTAVSHQSFEFSPHHLSLTIDTSGSLHHPRLRSSSKSGTLLSRSSASALSGGYSQPSSPESYFSAYHSPLDGILEVKAEVKAYRDSRFLNGRVSTPDLRTASQHSPTKSSQKKKKAEEKRKRKDSDVDKTLSGTARFKAWLKRMVIPSYEDSSETETDEAEFDHLPIQRPPTLYFSASDEAAELDATISNALRTSEIVLDAAYRDLANIRASLASVSTSPLPDLST